MWARVASIRPVAGSKGVYQCLDDRPLDRCCGEGRNAPGDHVLAGLLIRRHRSFTAGFTALTFVLGALLIVVYLGRLIVLTPSSPLVLLPAALNGFVVNPLWYGLLGLALRRSNMAVAETNAPVAA